MNILSWNMNGNFAERHPIVCEMLKSNQIVCIQEHFALPISVGQLDIFRANNMYVVPAVRKKDQGRPSGGLVTYISNDVESKLFFSTQNILAVQVCNFVVVNVYMPTDYRDDASHSEFAQSLRKLAECLSKIRLERLPCVILGDFNCPMSAEFTETNALFTGDRESMVHGLLDDTFTILEKNQNFTYIHNTGSTSNLDHVICSKDLLPTSVRVSGTTFTSDHFSIELQITPPATQSEHPHQNNAAKTTKKWTQIRDWNNVNTSVYTQVSDEILAKIKIPFNLLIQSRRIEPKEARLELDIYAAQITHALRSAEEAAVPIKKIKTGTQVSGWSQNAGLVNACNQAKFWLSVWKECGRPRIGVVNAVRLLTKRKFGKELALHRSNVIAKSSEDALRNPDLIWKTLSERKPNFAASSISLESWRTYYEQEFKSPCPTLSAKYKAELHNFLSSTDRSDVTVSVSEVQNVLRRIKKKKSRGADGISALHLKNPSSMLIQHLALLFQMIFVQGVVPSNFCIGSLTPVPKKGKPLEECTSFRPITISTTFCKIFELLIIKEINEKCYAPPSQFGFQPGLGCGHALSVVASVLIDAESSGESVAIGIHDVKRAFDSLIHDQIILEMGKRGVQRDVIMPLKDMYENLQAQIKVVSPEKNISEIYPTVPVRKGARQGAPTSAPAFNNSVLPAQENYQITCVLDGIDLSLLCYADDILNMSRNIGGIECNFAIFQKQYAAIGLEFNAAKSEVLLFNWPENQVPPTIDLGQTSIKPADHIIYLGLPIGKTLRHTRQLLIQHLEKRTGFAYSRLVATKFSFNRFILARLYTALALPHFLYLSPFWRTFPCTTKQKLRAIFFKYAKYLLRLPPWTRNTYLINRYKLADPTLIIENQISRFNSKIGNHPWHSLLKQ